MPTKCLIKSGEYHDSVALMETARALSQLPGVQDAALVMATEANKGILGEAGLLRPEIEAASPAGFPLGFDRLFFGGRCDNQSNWEGRLDEIAVFDRALSAEEIGTLSAR